MRVECIHGYFKFFETRPGQISEFVSRYGLDISRSDDHFTFESLVEAPDFSLPGGEFLGAATTAAFEGKPWEVMRANSLVYDFTKDLVVPIASIIRPAKLSLSGKFYVSDGMILPGSVTEDGSRVKDYAAFYENLTFRYSEVGHE